jgi:ribose 1,5-bisphosphokinase PhnN
MTRVVTFAIAAALAVHAAPAHAQRANTALSDAAFALGWQRLIAPSSVPPRVDSAIARRAEALAEQQRVSRAQAERLHAYALQREVQIECPMPVMRPDTTRVRPMERIAVDTASLPRVARCVNPLDRR